MEEMNRKELKNKFKEYSERDLSDDERKLIRKITKQELIRLGARVDFVGFDCLCVAVELVIEKPSLVHNVCADLYPMVANIVGLKSGEAVERNIRSLIEYISDEKSFIGLNKIFNGMLFDIEQKPTTTELIRLLAEFYLLGFWKKEIKEKAV